MFAVDFVCEGSFAMEYDALLARAKFDRRCGAFLPNSVEVNAVA